MTTHSDVTTDGTTTADGTVAGDGTMTTAVTSAAGDRPFVHRVEVRFYEVDQVGVVFNAWYLAWCDDARLAYCAARGYGLEEARTHDAVPLVRHADIEWLASLAAGDHAEVVVRPVRVGTTSFTLRHEIHRAGDGELCAVLTITYVAAGLVERAKRELPLSLRAALEQDQAEA